jgi:hypothetical protein
VTLYYTEKNKTRRSINFQIKNFFREGTNGKRARNVAEGSPGSECLVKSAAAVVSRVDYGGMCGEGKEPLWGRATRGLINPPGVGGTPRPVVLTVVLPLNQYALTIIVFGNFNDVQTCCVYHLKKTFLRENPGDSMQSLFEFKTC